MQEWFLGPYSHSQVSMALASREVPTQGDSSQLCTLSELLLSGVDLKSPAQLPLSGRAGWGTSEESQSQSTPAASTAPQASSLNPNDLSPQ